MLNPERLVHRFLTLSFPCSAKRAERREQITNERQALRDAAGDALDDAWYIDAKMIMRQLWDNPDSAPFRQPIDESEV